MKIVAILIQLYYISYFSVIVYLLIHPTHEIVNILIIANSKKGLIVINTDSIIGHKVNIDDTVKN